MAEKPDLALLLGQPVADEEDVGAGDELEPEEDENEDAHAAEVVALLDTALDRKASPSERYAAFADAIALCGE